MKWSAHFVSGSFQLKTETELYLIKNLPTICHHMEHKYNVETAKSALRSQGSVSRVPPLLVAEHSMG